MVLAVFFYIGHFRNFRLIDLFQGGVPLLSWRGYMAESDGHVQREVGQFCGVHATLLPLRSVRRRRMILARRRGQCTSFDSVTDLVSG